MHCISFAYKLYTLSYYVRATWGPAVRLKIQTDLILCCVQVDTIAIAGDSKQHQLETRSHFQVLRPMTREGLFFERFVPIHSERAPTCLGLVTAGGYRNTVLITAGICLFLC